VTSGRPIPSVAAECAALLANVARPTVPDVLPIVRAYYALPGNGAGGSLRVVLDDYNAATDFVDFCIEIADARGDAHGAALGLVLRRMSKTQRLKLARAK
jgi:hypothetical protein